MKRNTRRWGAVLAAAVAITIANAGSASASINIPGTGRCGTQEPLSEDAACIVLFYQGSTDSLMTGGIDDGYDYSPYGIYDTTATTQICSGTGTDCSTQHASSDDSGTIYEYYYAGSSTASYGHDYRSVDSWTDAYPNAPSRYTALDSPFYPFSG